MSASELLYNLDAARSDEQRAYMQRLEQAGICIFCPEHIAEYQSAPVELSGRHWLVTENAFPYQGTTAHYLIIARSHVISFHELPDAAGAELWAIKRELKQRFEPLAVATVERSGDIRYNGGSVAHLHTHFVALPGTPTTEVRFRVSARAV